ncbi:MAG: ABC transporter permease [Cyclobacteriaceae bacterium]
MVRNYLITSYRNLVRNGFLSILNIAGLAIGIACFLLIFQYVQWEKSYDAFHHQPENIYRVSNQFLKNGDLDFHSAATFPLVGPAMKSEFPEVLEQCRLMRKWRGGIVEHENISFEEGEVTYADASFFKIFGFPLITGSPNEVLLNPQTAVIDKSTAIKYFGDDDPVGKRITIGSMMGVEEFEITGVFISTPNSHLKFNFILSYESLINVWGQDANSAWGWWDFHTYIKLDENADPSILEEKLPQFADKHGGERTGSKRVRFDLQQLPDIYQYSNLRHEIGKNGDGETIAFLLLISIFILGIAWTNYVNLTTAKAFNRSKEIGIRKTMGSKKSQLTIQFLIEALLVNLAAIIIGLIIFLLALPFFYQLVGKAIPIDFVTQPNFWIQLLIVWVGGSMISGFYPALVMSSFKPTDALKSTNPQKGQRSILRKALVVIQFIASSALISGTLIVYSQLSFMKSQPTGIETNRVLAINAPEVIIDEESFYQTIRNYKNTLNSNSAVKAVSISSDIPGKQVSWMGSCRRTDKSTAEAPGIIAYKHVVDQDYFDIYQNQLIAGRNFDRPSDSSYVVLNRQSLKDLGFESPQDALNKPVSVSGFDTLTVLGVIENFHQETLKKGYEPILYLLTEQENRHLSVKVNSDEVQEFLAFAEAEFQNTFPLGVFNFTFVDDYVEAQYADEDTFFDVFVVFACLAIFLALLGLMGLAFYATEQRRKEISIRKVLGSSIVGVFILLVKDVTKLVVLAYLIATPLIIYYSNEWLNNFAFREEFNWFLLPSALILTLGIAIGVISYHIIKAAYINPAITLRNNA